MQYSYISSFSAVILAANIISSEYLYVLFFMIGFSVSSMLLAFSVVEEIFPIQVRATALAIVNMVIGLCGAVFQYLISIISVYVNNGPLTGTINENVFDKSFVYLLVPLLCSTLIISLLVLEKRKHELIKHYNFFSRSTKSLFDKKYTNYYSDGCKP